MGWTTCFPNTHSRVCVCVLSVPCARACGRHIRWRQRLVVTKCAHAAPGDACAAAVAAPAGAHLDRDVALHHNTALHGAHMARDAYIAQDHDVLPDTDAAEGVWVAAPRDDDVADHQHGRCRGGVRSGSSWRGTSSAHRRWRLALRVRSSARVACASHACEVAATRCGDSRAARRKCAG